MAKHGKKFRAVKEKARLKENYELAEAFQFLKENKVSNFDESVDIAIRLGVNPRHADQIVRGTVSLPHATGKTKVVAVFAQGEKLKEAEEAGADFFGADDLIEKVQGGWLDFDVAIATPDFMGKVGRLGRVLGPRGLMPNPKSGTVTMDVAGAVKDVKGGKIAFRVEKAGIIHATIGRLSFGVDQLVENATTLIDTVIKMKPAAAKGTYLLNIATSSTMGVGLKIDIPHVVSLLRV